MVHREYVESILLEGVVKMHVSDCHVEDVNRGRVGCSCVLDVDRR